MTVWSLALIFKLQRSNYCFACEGLHGQVRNNMQHVVTLSKQSFQCYVRCHKVAAWLGLGTKTNQAAVFGVLGMRTGRHISAQVQKIIIILL